MRALDAVRTHPVRLVTRLHTDDPEAGMSTAQYAVGTVVSTKHGKAASRRASCTH